MILLLTLILSAAAIALNVALRAHRLPNHDFLLRHEVVNPAIYDHMGKILLGPTILLSLAAIVAWGVLIAQ